MTTPETEIELLKRSCAELHHKLDQVVESIVGNGKPGLKTDVELLKQAVRRVWYFISGAVAVGAPAVIAIVWG